MKAITALFLALFYINAQACENGFFPKNDFQVNFSVKSSDDAKQQLTPIIANIKEIYSPVFQEQSKTLNIEILWDESNVNAYATRDLADNPVVRITGGMMRHPNLSPDGMALILCHEIGHFLGGSPKKLRGNSTKKSWSSAEGQADYYATASCLKKLFKYDSRKQNKSNISDLRIQQEVNQICKTPECVRLAKASVNVAEVYAQIDFYTNKLSVLHSDTNTVYYTTYGHPNPQCRLDTMVNALLCPNSENLQFDSNDPISGACRSQDLRRPRCWYYPQVESSANTWDL